MYELLVTPFATTFFTQELMPQTGIEGISNLAAHGQKTRLTVPAAEPSGTSFLGSKADFYRESNVGRDRWVQRLDRFFGGFL